MTNFVQSIISGLGAGAIYVAVALGFSIVYKSARVVNFAHGQYLVVGGIVATILVKDMNWALPFVILSVLVIGVALGVGTEVVVFRILKRPDHLVMTLGTVAVGLIIETAVLIPTDGGLYSLTEFPGPRFSIASVIVSSQLMWNLFIAISATVILQYFFHRTRRGITLQAAADDRTTASIFGISAGTTTLWSFGIAGALGTLAGIMYTPLSPMTFSIGLVIGLKGFAAAMLGGLGSMKGALLGGIVIGLLEGFTATYTNSFISGLIPFITLLLVLLFKPSGIFKEVAVERV
jgi:branched-chain amino acid transport system permease protein